MSQQAPVETGVAAQPRFGVERWAGFWAKPDADLAARAAVPDVVGDWPGDPEPVRGVDAYRDRIAQVLAQVPDLHLEVLEHAENGDVLFIHWMAYGTGADGPFQIDGIDRILLENGLVKENIIRYDSATFEAFVAGGAQAAG